MIVGTLSRSTDGCGKWETCSGFAYDLPSEGKPFCFKKRWGNKSCESHVQIDRVTRLIADTSMDTPVYTIYTADAVYILEIVEEICVPKAAQAA